MGSIQRSVAVRNGGLDAWETVIGTTPILRIRTGAPPATCATADSGTILVAMTLPSDWMAAASSGTKALAGSWSAASSNSGTAGHWRIYDAAGTTCHMQGYCTLSVPLTTNALTAANSNVLNFAATTGVTVGMTAVGTGIPDNATVLAVGGATVTLTHASVAGVASSASITFGGSITLDNTSIVAPQVVTVSTNVWTAADA